MQDQGALSFYPKPSQEQWTRIRRVHWNGGDGLCSLLSIWQLHIEKQQVWDSLSMKGLKIGGQLVRGIWAIDIFSQEQKLFASKDESINDCHQWEVTFDVCSPWPHCDLQPDLGIIDSTGFVLCKVRGSRVWGWGRVNYAADSYLYFMWDEEAWFLFYFFEMLDCAWWAKQSLSDWCWFASKVQVSEFSDYCVAVVCLTYCSFFSLGGTYE